MNLLVDATSMNPINKGVGKYAEEVLMRICKYLDEEWRIIAVVFEGCTPGQLQGSRIDFLEVPKTSELRLGLILLPQIIRQTRAGLLLKLHDSCGLGFNIPSVTVCHDIDELIEKAKKHKKSIIRFIIDHIKDWLRIRSLKKSDMIVCNSGFILEQCHKRYRIDLDRMTLGYCGVANEYYDSSKDKASKRIHDFLGVSRYILTFATGDPREGYQILPRIISKARQLGLVEPFVIGGIKDGSGYAKQLSIALTSQGLREYSDYYLCPFIGREDKTLLADLYCAAEYYLELSRHEGFGMQLAEAMASGVHCFAPDHSALSEVGGRFVTRIDNGDADEIATTIAAVASADLPSDSVGPQILHTKKFCWEKTSKVIAESLMKLAN